MLPLAASCHGSGDIISVPFDDALAAHLKSVHVSHFEGDYHCGVNKYWHFQVNATSKICTIEAVDAIPSLRFGAVRIEDEHKESIQKISFIFSPLICSIATHFMENGKSIPEHCMLTYCQNEIASNDEYNPESPTADFIQKFIKKTEYLKHTPYATNPEFVFALRMKAIIDRVKGDELQRIMLVFNDLQADLLYKIVTVSVNTIGIPDFTTINQIFSLICNCSQLIPHLIFYDIESPINDVFEKYYEEYCKNMASLPENNNEDKSPEVKEILSSINKRQADLYLNMIKEEILNKHRGASPSN